MGVSCHKRIQEVVMGRREEDQERVLQGATLAGSREECSQVTKGAGRRGSLRCLPPLEVRPSSVAPDPAESRGAPNKNKTRS